MMTPDGNAARIFILDSNGHLLVLTNLPANAQRLFTLTGLSAHLVIQ